MTYRIAYGVDTKSVEDARQIVLIDLPDSLEYDDLEDLLADDWDSLEPQGIVGVDDAVSILDRVLTELEVDNRVAIKIIRTYTHLLQTKEA